MVMTHTLEKQLQGLVLYPEPPQSEFVPFVHSREGADKAKRKVGKISLCAIAWDLMPRVTKYLTNTGDLTTALPNWEG